jgi:adenosylcobinamide kinase/adenosylcobinamide-phosphate guanylyltransferase
MEEKIKKHRAERGPDWRTIEEPLHVPQALKGAPTDAPVLLDCLTLWLSNLMGSSQDCFETAPFLAKLEDLIQSAQSRKGPLIVVSNEVGYGLVPIDAVSRFFRDLSGLSHQLIAKNASEVYLVAAGIAQKLK